MSLDHRDSDPALFWIYLVTAMRAAVPDLGESALALLASAGASTDAALAALLNEIETLPHDLVLALDEYHVIELPADSPAKRVVADHSHRTASVFDWAA